MFSYFGICPDARESLILFEAVKLGLIPAISDRLSEEERKEIVSGAIYIWDERRSPMRRWTDGRTWSNSRVVGDFLEYRESVPDEKNGRYSIKPYGLRKRSICLPSYADSSLRLIAYFSSVDVKRGVLKTPSRDPMFAAIVQKMNENPSEHLSLQSLVSMKRRKRSKSNDSDSLKPDKVSSDARLRSNVAIAPAPPRIDGSANSRHSSMDRLSPKSENEHVEDTKPSAPAKDSEERQAYSPPVLVYPQVPQPQISQQQYMPAPLRSAQYAPPQLVQPQYGPTTYVQPHFIHSQPLITPILTGYIGQMDDSRSIIPPDQIISPHPHMLPHSQIPSVQYVPNNHLVTQVSPSLQTGFSKAGESQPAALKEVLPTFISTPPNDALVLPSPIWRPQTMHSEDRRALGLLDSSRTHVGDTK